MHNSHPILKEVGHILTPVSFCFLVPMIIAFSYKEYYSILAFLIPFLICFSLGSFLDIKYKKTTKEPLTLKDSLAMIFFLWLFITLLSSIPYMLIENLSFIDGFFESVSSFTTTGFSVLDFNNTSHVIFFWRSFGQWIGGLGIIVFALTDIFKAGNRSYLAEGKNERILPNILSTLKTIWFLYAGYTILGILFLMVFGMPFFDSVVHSMSAIATGGMSTKFEGISYFNSIGVEIVILILMIFGAVSFKSHYSLLTGKIKEFFKDIQFLIFLIIITISVSVMMIHLGFWDAFFHSISALTTTGYNISNISFFAPSVLIIMTILMIIGGSSGSSAGGIKLIRVGVLHKIIEDGIKKIFSPDRVFSKKVGDRVFSDEEMFEIIKFSQIYVVIFLISGIILMYNGFSPVDSLFHSASAIGNVGLSTVSEFNLVSKIVFIFEMFAGRLEIWSVLVFIAYISRKGFNFIEQKNRTKKQEVSKK
jgi:trk system potassium uptake protein